EGVRSLEPPAGAMVLLPSGQPDSREQRLAARLRPAVRSLGLQDEAPSERGGPRALPPRRTRAGNPGASRNSGGGAGGRLRGTTAGSEGPPLPLGGLRRFGPRWS